MSRGGGGDGGGGGWHPPLPPLQPLQPSNQIRHQLNPPSGIGRLRPARDEKKLRKQCNHQLNMISEHKMSWWSCCLYHCFSSAAGHSLPIRGDGSWLPLSPLCLTPGGEAARCTWLGLKDIGQLLTQGLLSTSTYNFISRLLIIITIVIIIIWSQIWETNPTFSRFL